MKSERWRQIEEVFHAALERKVHERGEYLRQACGGDQTLRREVESLLARESSGSRAVLNRLAPDPGQSIGPGARIGPYEIKSSLGAGGMGEVYRARDTKLKRDVALKILPVEFGDDPDRLARFQREAYVLASLNHPNIAQIYGFEEGALVMELVTGESPKGPMPFEEAWNIASQIAAALDYAHERRVIHRDLKPANIKVTPDGVVKVLDFGLAKALGAQDMPEEDEDDSATATLEETRSGVILGTGPYMAPEQAVGKKVDQRADIWAFGVVLYELLAGKRPFGGQGLTKTIAAILHDTPDFGPIPPQARAVLERCLEKDPKKRLRHIGDLPLLLGLQSSATPVRRPAWPFAAALTIVTLLLAALAFVHFRERVPQQPSARMSVLLPANSRVLSLAVSPDAREIAMVLVHDGKQQIWVRPLDSLESTPLPGTDDAAFPFWSPDSRYIAFFADARLKKIDRSGGPVQTLCEALGASGGSWNRSDDIIIGGLRVVQRIAAGGGTPVDLPKHTVPEMFPVFLPDGVHYLGRRTGGAAGGVWLSSTDGPESQRILPDLSNAAIVEPPPGGQIGEVLFARNGNLMALPFDMKRLRATGDAFVVAQQVAAPAANYWLASSSSHGVLAIVPGQRREHQYVWRDRHGATLGIAAGNAGAVVMISPDGRQLTGDRNGDVWVLQPERSIATRLTFTPPGSINPIWSPDGRFVAYGRLGSGIYRKLATGAGAEELLVAEKRLAAPKSWSPDGRYILYAQINPSTGADLLGLPVEPKGQPFPVVQTHGTDDQGQFSPDGHWVAYTSNESGLSEIYVIPFPPSSSDGKWLVSHVGGVQPRWSRNGKELFYISPDSKMMAVDVTTSAVFQAGTPHSLFQTEIVDTGIRTGPMSWDLAPDGNRFLIISDSSTDSSLTVWLNWRPSTR